LFQTDLFGSGLGFPQFFAAHFPQFCGIAIGQQLPVAGDFIRGGPSAMAGAAALTATAARKYTLLRIIAPPQNE